MLADTLEHLSEQTVAAIRRYHMDGERRMHRTRKLRAVVDELHFAGGIPSYTANVQAVERMEWPLSDQYRFIEKRIKPLDVFAECVREIVDAYGQSEASAELQLKGYLQVLSSEAVGQGEDRPSASLIRTFLSDLEGGPKRWTVKSALSGITIGVDKCEFGKYRLRRPVASDLETEETVDADAPAVPNNPLLDNPPTAILEFETLASEPNAVKREHERVLELLRLFRLGLVRSLAFTSMPSSVLQIGGTLYSIPRQGEGSSYELTTSDRDTFAGFVERCGPVLERLDVIEDDRMSYLCQAKKLYASALQAPLPVEKGLGRTIACLELIFRADQLETGGQEQVAQRVGSLLGLCGKDPARFLSDIRSAYKMYVGDSDTSNTIDSDSRECYRLVRSVMESARIALAVWIQLTDRAEKEHLLDQLDDAQAATGACDRSIGTLVKSSIVPL